MRLYNRDTKECDSETAWEIISGHAINRDCGWPPHAELMPRYDYLQQGKFSRRVEIPSGNGFQICAFGDNVSSVVKDAL